MTSTDVLLLVVALGLVFVAGLLASIQTAISSMSKVRAGELVAEGRPGATRLLDIVSDPARFVNTALLAVVACETTAIVIVAKVVTGLVSPAWLGILVAAVVMIVVSYIAVGVGPQTVGRKHYERVALTFAAPMAALSLVLGPLAQVLIMLGNAVTPGKGFREGPFASEAELRELVDLAEQSAVIQSGESKMIHSVFELGDTLAREVMVPRIDMVFIERHKTLRQMMSLALRSGFSRIPVIGDDLDDVIGIAYLKDVTKRVFDNREAESTERIERVMRECSYVPDSKPADELMRDMQARRTHVAIVVDEYGGTAGLVTIEDLLEEIVGEITDEYDVEPDEIEHVNGGVRVRSRLPVDELEDLFRVQIDDEDVETVGGLMAKHLGRVPIPGAEVVCAGLRFRAESLAGRRNKVVTVFITRVDDVPSAADPDATASDGMTGTRDGADDSPTPARDPAVG
ncbi:MAG: magnesium and cobalt exporter, family [Nocardioidaceae bacterium]|jgi:CBS domain containing-hemolysin-like protein|nr:magnesium and cobalt exporter, family [Nocardioidaceae bacterium]